MRQGCFPFPGEQLRVGQRLQVKPRLQPAVRLLRRHCRPPAAAELGPTRPRRRLLRRLMQSLDLMLSSYGATSNTIRRYLPNQNNTFILYKRAGPRAPPRPLRPPPLPPPPSSCAHRPPFPPSPSPLQRQLRQGVVASAGADADRSQ